MLAVTQNLVSEWSFLSEKTYSDPFNDLELSVLFTSDTGNVKLVPAFWAGESLWRVRFSSPVEGKFHYRTICSDISNRDLHDQQGDFAVVPYTGSNPLYLHGPIQIAANKRHFEHIDGTPFFWLADTWWMGLTKRLDWPNGFQTLALDRIEKGFNVIQIVAGLYPDMPAFDERGANEAGFPWDEKYSSINPEYFEYADRRIEYLVNTGLVPCIVACWGYFISFMGADKMKKHWRYLIARYGAYPVFWCLAGEASMPYYMSETKDEDKESQKKGWTELAAYVRETDSFRRPTAIHPSDEGRNQVGDPSLLDFEMLQTGHGDRLSIPITLELMNKAVKREPLMPVLNSEVCYEGIGESCRQEIQRFMFWSCVLSGACGHTYGANGIWQVNTRDKAYGPSPHGLAWGNTPWEDAYRLPGSAQLGLDKRFLENYEWWHIEPHPEWVDNDSNPANVCNPFAAGIPGKLRIIYWPFAFAAGIVRNVESDSNYHAFLFNPIDGSRIDLGSVVPDNNGDWKMPCGNDPWYVMPIYQDWVLVMES